MLIFQLCRHGIRNIAKSYPNDPYQALEYWPEGYGQLTKVKTNHYILRHRFVNDELNEHFRSVKNSIMYWASI